MADVDDEFLALVGGDESSDEDFNQAENDGDHGSRAASESPLPDDKTKKSKRRGHDDSDEEEEGEASSVGSPASQQSAPMDESDSDNDVSQLNNSNGKMADDEGTSYPVDGIYASEAEKEEILAMPELEREQLLAERQQEVDRQRQNTLLRALLKNREDDAQSVKKRKASAAELDDTQRKTSRQRTKVGGSKVGETSAGIETLRRARAEKNDRLRRREEDRERHKDKSISFARSSSDRGDDSDVEWTGTGRNRASKSRTPEVKEIPLADLRDFERIRLGRSRFREVCFYPGFEETITGCYARISIGPDREGVNQYRMALIKGFTQGKPYAMEKANGQSFVTDQYVRAAHGKAERDWPFLMCSDSPFTEAEFNRYKAVLQDEGIAFPKKPALGAKIDDINALLNRSWTDAEVNEKIERERSLRKKYAPSERDRLQKSIEEARRRGDDARVAQLQDQLDTLETPRLAFKTSLTPNKKSAPSTPSQQDRLAQINAENRRKNNEAVRKAQIQEKAKLRGAQARLARGESVDDDSARLSKTKPNGDRPSTPANGSGASTPANGTPKLGATPKGALLPHIAKLQIQNQAGTDKKGLPQIHKPIVDDDVIAAMDLDIDVDID
ncbi:hypothetical protein DL769_004312 [Monosporascus sp. CRB-8-3]|nr:hypothetical protein DL769_004312 [Monosporascus sp. CRB-8-3]